jgi:hypothetical protein
MAQFIKVFCFFFLKKKRLRPYLIVNPQGWTKRRAMSFHINRWIAIRLCANPGTAGMAG